MIKRKKNKYPDFFKESEKVMTSTQRKRANKKASDIITLLDALVELRKESGKRQSDIKGFSQTGVSKLETRTDVKLSTLIEYIHALGMKVEIKAVSPKKKDDEEIILLRA